MTPLARYQQELENSELLPDSEQLEVMRLLDSIAIALETRNPWSPSPSGFLSKWFGASRQRVSRVEGLYLWGGVGRGKTHLCDLFFSTLGFEDKVRLHFHRFMQRIHDDLRELGEVENPIPLVADKWAAQARLLMLDEIHVHDITDAMLLGGLLTELFKRGVTLITTSNVPPHELYKDGLQRARFLPAIEQITEHTRIYEMSGVTDYRLRLLQTEKIYLACEMIDGKCEQGTQDAMQMHFKRLSAGMRDARNTLCINQRELPVIARAGDLVWFSFDTLCTSPRSTSDYIEIATAFNTVMISDIPVLGSMEDDAARRLVNLIDEFYDRNIKLVVSAQALPDGLYTGKRLSFEFVRAASRLTEMQTTEYLRLPPHS